ncbi:hypothetical protein F0562_017878 [Nyssa sinensis]|uniref:Pectate lyase n=1 Tax=Nyssa sinensis TaxID=561372 RepID=A0A5J4ZJ10_9ASTE|nr:hypothetical protein F0562_017878 [Nyssa sinensis]
MTIRLNQELIMQSDKTIDALRVNVHIAYGAGITIQFVKNVIIHNLHVHDIVLDSGGLIRDFVDHVGLRMASDGNGISIYGFAGVWIDHVFMWNCKDGLIDAIEGSTGITISNCHFTDHNGKTSYFIVRSYFLMMAGSSYPPLAYPVAVINPQFCAPYPIDLIIVRKLLAITEGNFAVTDVNGNIMFKVKGTFFSIRDRRVLLDAAGNPIVSLQQKILTVHRRWQVFRGDSSDSKDLLFSVKKSSLIQFKTQLDVFLATNTKEEVCDFKVKGSWLERSCAIYAGDSPTIIAQVRSVRI